jgi:hypothetical protein
LNGDREVQRAANRKSYNKHQPSRRAAQKARREANPERACKLATESRGRNIVKVQQHDRNRNRLRNTGFTPELFEQRLTEQSGLCAICCCVLKMSKHSHADHCHATLQRRGVLCHGCNVGIGFLQDSPELVHAAALYLELWRTQSEVK